jgi:hypothetical protein
MYILVGLARIIYIRCINGIFGREIIKCTVIYGVYIRFWPTLVILLRSSLAKLQHHVLPENQEELFTNVCA